MVTDSLQVRLRGFERYLVSVSLRDGSHLDDCLLVSASRPGTPGAATVWLFNETGDVFVPVSEVVEVWERSS